MSVVKHTRATFGTPMASLADLCHRARVREHGAVDVRVGVDGPRTTKVVLSGAATRGVPDAGAWKEPR
jgi:hypothetical protein